MNILITGGTGSFGYALVAHLLHSGFGQRICIYSRDEHKQEKMRNYFDDNQKLRFFIGDIRDKARLAMALQNIQLIFHAAALKIVPLSEYNPMEYVKTNIVGAQNLIECLLENNLGNYKKVIALSTDKAVHPINLYGATKLTAEKLFLSANNMSSSGFPKFSVIRYGNVCNSNGSVIPLFKSQSEKEENITITHPDMTRFWITLDDVVKFAMKCADIMYGGEIFVPKMQAFKIKDLADIFMENYPLEKQFPTITGIRPGEKLYEEIITKEEIENTIFDENKQIYTIYPAYYEKLRTQDRGFYKGIKEITSNNVNFFTKDELRIELTKLGAI